MPLRTKKTSFGPHARLTPLTKSPPVASVVDRPSASETRLTAVALLTTATLALSGENAPPPEVPVQVDGAGSV